jgi:hypothetical protein
MAEPFDVNTMTETDEAPQAETGVLGPIDEPKPGPLNRANLMLAVLFAAGIVGLWMLSLRNGPQQASAQQKSVEMKIDAALTQFGAITAGKSATETAAVVDTFYYEAKQRQVPADELEGNPFVYVAPTSDSTPDATSSTPQPAARTEQAQTKAKALSAVKQLKLQSVLMGNGGVTAMISNNLLTKGQSIHGWTVTEITSRTVTLEWDDQQYVLEMPK